MQPSPVMWIFFGGLVLAAVLNIAAVLIQSKRSPQKPGSDVVQSKVEGRIFVGAHITPKFLTDFFQQHMTVEASRLVAPYIGKWICVSGTLQNIVEPTDSGVSVYINVSTPPADIVAAYFDKEWVDRLLMLQKGVEIIVVGQITDVDALYLKLGHCELPAPK